MNRTLSARLRQTPLVHNKLDVQRRAYKSSPAKRCRVWARRNKYRFRCRLGAWQESERGLCYHHEMFTPHFYRNGAINRDIKGLFDRGDYGNAQFIEFCLRIIKDNTRIVQVPLTTDFTKMRIDPRLPFVAYVILQEPTDPILRNSVKVDAVRWPLHFVLTNATRLFLNAARTDGVSSAYYGRRANIPREMPAEIPFDVFSAQYNFSEYFSMFHAFNVFFTYMKGYQIFNCKIGHVMPETNCNIRLGPMLVANLLRYATQLTPLFNLCFISSLAERAQDFFKHVERRDERPPQTTFLEDTLSVRSAMNNLEQSIFQQRDVKPNLASFEAIARLDAVLEEIVTNMYNQNVRLLTPPINLRLTNIFNYVDIYTVVRNYLERNDQQRPAYMQIVEEENKFRQENTRLINDHFAHYIPFMFVGSRAGEAPDYPDNVDNGLPDIDRLVNFNMGNIVNQAAIAFDEDDEDDEENPIVEPEANVAAENRGQDPDNNMLPELDVNIIDDFFGAMNEIDPGRARNEADDARNRARADDIPSDDDDDDIRNADLTAPIL